MASIRPELAPLPVTIELGDGPANREPSATQPLGFHDPETFESAPMVIPVLEPHSPVRPPSVAAYELLARIGEGGMGEVWEARQRALGRVVALKRLRDGRSTPPTIVRQFESEARLTAILDHPNIVTVHELGRDQLGRVFYTMKQIQGTAWSEVLANNRRQTSDGASVDLDLRDHLEILLEVSLAIAFAHSRGVIHRDIKPANVMIGDYGEVLVVDWGLAVALQPLETGAATSTLAELPASALVCGTPAYMSPETALAMRERIGTTTDVYLLGAVLYHVLYGRPPHTGSTVPEVISKAKVNGWSFPAKFARKHEAWDSLLRPLITRALASDPDLRFEDGAAFADALREALRNYDSAKVASRAERRLAAMDLEELTTDGGYKQISAIIAQLEGALESWPRNLVARRALGQAHLELAALALANDDLALARFSIEGFERLPPLPESDLTRTHRRMTRHPVDGTLFGAPQPTESIVAAQTSSDWVDVDSEAVPRGAAALGSTLGAAELVARRHAARGPTGPEFEIPNPSASLIGGPAASRVDIQQVTNDALRDDEAKHAARAQLLRNGLDQRERGVDRRRRVVRLALRFTATVGVLVVALIVVAGLAVQRARDAAERERNHLSRVLLDETANTIEAELEILFKPVHGVLQTSVNWARAGQLDIADPQGLNARFMPMLQGLEPATSMLCADTGGHEYMLTARPEGGWRTRVIIPGQPPQLHEWTRTGELGGVWVDERAYDPLTRPWYLGGAGLRDAQAPINPGNNPVHWTTPYKFFSTGELGISVSAPATSSTGRELVIAFDLRLGDISKVTRELPVGVEQGQVFVLDEQLRLLGLPRETAALDPAEQRAMLFEELDAHAERAPISHAALQAWEARDRPATPFRIELDSSRASWVGFRQLVDPNRPRVWIGVVVPERIED